MKKLFLLSVILSLYMNVCAQNSQSANNSDSIGKPYLNFWAIIETDVIYNINKIDPHWTSFFRPSKIPVKPGDPGWYETPGNLYFSIKPTTFKFEGVIPIKHRWNKIKLRFEFDLAGMGPYGPETGFRLRPTYGEWGHFRVGKDWSTFIDLANFPNIYEWWGPSGMALVPYLMFRYTNKFSERNQLELALEMPGMALDYGDVRNANPKLDSILVDYDFKTKEILPDFIIRYTHSGDFGYIKLMGLLRDLVYESPSIPNRGYVQERLFGWGFNMSTAINLFNGKLGLQAVLGEGYASYNNDGGYDITPALDDDPNTPYVEYKAVVPFQYGFTAFYDYNIGKRWSGSFGYSQTVFDNSSGQVDNEFHKSQYVVLQAIYQVIDGLDLGLNYQYGTKTVKDGTDGYNQRVLFNVTYFFSHVRDE